MGCAGIKRDEILKITFLWRKGLEDQNLGHLECVEALVDHHKKRRLERLSYSVKLSSGVANWATLARCHATSCRWAVSAAIVASGSALEP